MRMVQLTPRPLEAAAFAPFGTVIAFEPAGARLVNEGTACRADTAALFEQAGGLSPVLALYRAQAQALPLHLSLFERHPHATQSFLSLSVRNFLAVVAPKNADGLPDSSKAQAFFGQAGTGLSYRRDQWHTPLLAIGNGGDVMMLMAEGSATDCIEHRLDVPLFVANLPVPGSTTYGA
jgi:ureidoglycolate lyase